MPEQRAEEKTAHKQTQELACANQSQILFAFYAHITRMPIPGYLLVNLDFLRFWLIFLEIEFVHQK